MITLQKKLGLSLAILFLILINQEAKNYIVVLVSTTDSQLLRHYWGCCDIGARQTNLEPRCFAGVLFSMSNPEIKLIESLIEST